MPEHYTMNDQEFESIKEELIASEGVFLTDEDLRNVIEKSVNDDRACREGELPAYEEVRDIIMGWWLSQDISEKTTIYTIARKTYNVIKDLKGRQ